MNYSADVVLREQTLGDGKDLRVLSERSKL